MMLVNTAAATAKRCRQGLLLLATAACACGVLGGDAGGARDLPAAAIIPWAEARPSSRCDAASPVAALQDPRTSLEDPWVVAGTDRLALYYTSRNGGGSEIFVAESTDGLHFGTPRRVLRATLDWHGTAVAAPSVVRYGNLWLLFFSADNGGAIGIARASTGTTFQSDATAILVPQQQWEGPSLERPSAVVEGRTVHLYFGVANGAGFGLAQSTDGKAFVRVGVDAKATSGPVIPRTDNLLHAPAVHAYFSPLGRRIIQLWFREQRQSGSSAGIFVAASQEGAPFERFDTAVWSPTGLQPHSVGRATFAGREWMFVSQRVAASDPKRAIVPLVWGTVEGPVCFP